jgi:hypothetical protein
MIVIGESKKIMQFAVAHIVASIQQHNVMVK